MEKTYKLVIEFIAKLCEKNDYNTIENVKEICAMALKMDESGGEDVCA